MSRLLVRLQLNSPRRNRRLNSAIHYPRAAHESQPRAPRKMYIAGCCVQCTSRERPTGCVCASYVYEVINVA